MINNNKNFDKKNKKHYQNTNYNNQYNKKRHNDDVRVVSTNINKDNNQNINEKKQNVQNNNKNVRSYNQERDYRKDKKFNFNLFENKDKNIQNQNIVKNDKQKFFNNNNNKFKNQNNRQRIPRTIIPYLVKALKKEICSKCNRLINDMPNSIYNSQNDEYYHFDCILRELRLNNMIKNNQRLVYTGSGSFAIIEDVTENGRKKFVIKKSLPYITKKEQ